MSLRDGSQMHSAGSRQPENRSTAQYGFFKCWESASCCLFRSCASDVTFPHVRPAWCVEFENCLQPSVRGRGPHLPQFLGHGAEEVTICEKSEFRLCLADPLQEVFKRWYGMVLCFDLGLTSVCACSCVKTRHASRHELMVRCQARFILTRCCWGHLNPRVERLAALQGVKDEALCLCGLFGRH